ncbi:lipase secretion chaperone [Vibrio vulnificus]|uniref:lipase secretion chaperone n=1 Tax=Vibrio vulnificus TaxID=672 RepID=UPI001CDC5717|nr:lipase secretion chaperone [Vibrio vulnificus]MCA3913030.1 lipase secretion chaperone [Vibrio vulnificus]MCG6314755.1 lipase secretion chaperone [Vibrio vulnificus]
MKKTALTIIMIALGSLGAVYFLPSEPAAQKDIRATSQHDTSVDNTSPKAFLDYSLSTLGEKPLQAITQDVVSEEGVLGELQLDEQLFALYLRYKRALADLDVEITGSDITSLETLHQVILDLQREYFSAQQIDLIFGEENQLRALALEKARLSEQGYSAEEQKQLWRDRLALQPEYVQESDANRRLMSELAQGEDAQTTYLKRVELVGEAGAQRLEVLDQNRAEFDRVFQHYLVQRSAILDDLGLSDEQKRQQITMLRESSFDVKQWRRIEALERIADGG